MLDLVLVTDSRPLGPGARSELDPLLAAFSRRGVRARLGAWDDPAFDWASVGVAVLRTTWNYHHHETVPTEWIQGSCALDDLLARRGWDEAVLSVGPDHAFTLLPGAVAVAVQEDAYVRDGGARVEAEGVVEPLLIRPLPTSAIGLSCRESDHRGAEMALLTPKWSCVPFLPLGVWYEGSIRHGHSQGYIREPVGGFRSKVEEEGQYSFNGLTAGSYPVRVLSRQYRGPTNGSFPVVVDANQWSKSRDVGVIPRNLI